jgi:hypothetical protein
VVVVTAVSSALLVIPGSASATGTTPVPKKVVGAFAPVSSCGSLSGMSMSWTSTANVVTAITLTSIPAACNGASLRLVLVNSSNTSLATAGPQTVSGTSMTISTLTGSATATSVAGSYVSVAGP